MRVRLGVEDQDGYEDMNVCLSVSLSMRARMDEDERKQGQSGTVSPFYTRDPPTRLGQSWSFPRLALVRHSYRCGSAAYGCTASALAGDLDPSQARGDVIPCELARCAVDGAAARPGAGEGPLALSDPLPERNEREAPSGGLRMAYQLPDPGKQRSRISAGIWSIECQHASTSGTASTWLEWHRSSRPLSIVASRSLIMLSSIHVYVSLVM